MQGKKILSICSTLLVVAVTTGRSPSFALDSTAA